MTGPDGTGRVDSAAPRWALAAIVMGLAIAGCAGRQVETAPPDQWPPAGPRVIAFTGGMVAVSAGLNDGIRKGTVLEVRRDGEPVAKLRVEAVGSDVSAGIVLEQSLAIRLGDAAKAPAGLVAPRRPIGRERPKRRRPSKRPGGVVAAVRGDWAFIDIGSRHGVTEGMELIVHRGAHFVAHLRIREVAEEAAAGEILDEVLAPAIGDETSAVRD